MKRWIHANSKLDSAAVFLEDSIDLTINLPLSIVADVLGAKDYSLRFDKWTTVDNFRKEVVELLTKKYRFKVITENIDGKKQKGWTTDRENSPSIYLNTFYNLVNAASIAQELGLPLGKLTGATKVKCFIHLSISDHTHADAGSIDHQQFIEDNSSSHTEGVDDLAMKFNDEHIKISELIYRDYKAGFNELEDELKDHIRQWIVAYNKSK